MPLYDYRCPQCGLEFEVSRPISRAGEPALCPWDKTESERVFKMPMTFVRDGTKAPTESTGESSAGHGLTHGPGGHTHGPGGHTHSPF
jgi:putative FmdB family regulatory protein